MEKITTFTPAWDKRDPDPSKDYGIGSVKCMMILKGEKGAVHFTFSTGMLLEKTVTEYIKTGRAKYELTSYGHYYLNKPMGYDVGYHSPTPQYEGQEIFHPAKMIKTGDGILDIKWEKIGDQLPVCEWIGVPCYCDGSALRGDEWLNIFIEKGSDEIWKLLEEYYNELYN